MFPSFARPWLSRPSRLTRRPHRPALQVERLEDRLAPATFVVNTNADDNDAAASMPPAGADGTLSLREAIIASNNTPSTPAAPNVINFNLAGTAPFTINVGSSGQGALPALTQPVVLDGTSQAGFASSPLVVVDGSQAGTGANGLDLQTGGITVKALVICRWSLNGIKVESNDGTASDTITGCYLGTDPTGTSALPNQQNGILIDATNSNNAGLSASNTAISNNVLSGNGNDGILITAINGIAAGTTLTGNFIGTNVGGTQALPNSADGIALVSASGATIGGTTAPARNVISGNGNDGVRIAGTTANDATFNLVEGNYIGVDSTGNRALGNPAGSGVEVDGGTHNTIGGESAGARNVIGANLTGIDLNDGAQNNMVLGNYVGIGADNATAVGNRMHGIVLHSKGNAGGQTGEPGVQNNLIGGETAGDGNTVAFNGTAGVAVFGNPVSLAGEANTGNAILGNSIFQNGRTSVSTLIGIDLSTLFPFPRDDGVTPNDSQGHGAANDPNNFQNFPVITSVMLPSGGGTTIAGTLTQSSSPNTTFQIELFANNPDPMNGIAEGQTFLTRQTVTTDATGKASFSVTVATTLTKGQTVTATATDPASNTSEFSAAFGLTFAQTIGSFDPSTGIWYLRNSNSAGAPDAGQFAYGGVGWLPVVGDWDGNGTQTVGVVDPSTATWYLRNENSAGAPDAGTFQFGLPGWIPVAGDWNHSGHTGIGMFDPSTGTWYLRNEASGGAPDAGQFAYGGIGWTPVVGDWTNSGKTTVGVVDPSTMTWYLRNSNASGAPDITPFAYGGVGWKPVAGDWDGNGTSTPAVVDPLANWYIRNSNAAGAPDITPFAYGLGTWRPVSGDWDFPAVP
jgi:hypothetical protein